MKKLYILLIFVCVIFTSTYAYNSLRVLDPGSWMSTSGKIENAKITITPEGLFFKCDLELTITTSQPEYFTEEDLLEIEYFFDLPHKSMIIESFLWVGDSLVRAELRDVWSANAIYESIVSRRRDPSVLYKRGDNSYELRVYPMKRNESRTVIISFLIPAQWNNNQIIACIPVQILNQSPNGPDNFCIIVNSQDATNEPEIIESGYSDFTFGNFNGNTCWFNCEAYVKNTINLSVALNSPIDNGIYLSTYPVNENEGIYELALLPSTLLEGHVSSKVLVVIDYDVERTTFSKNNLIGLVYNAISSCLIPVDSFNLIYSKLNPSVISDDWIPADSISIVNTFKDIDANDMTNYSLLPTTLAAAIKYVDENQGGEILLITSSNEEGSYKTANLLIEDLLAIPDKKPVIHTVNISNFNTIYFYQSGYNYYGDEYFLSVLSRKTGGNYLSIKEQNSKDITSLLNNAFGMLEGTITNADLYSDCENGFCYSKYFLNDIHKGIYINNPVLQIGKYIGDSPFSFTLSGMIDGIPFSEIKTVYGPDISMSEESLATLWAGLKIDNLEDGNHSNDNINEIISESLDNHVLSLYTAFLALEPGMNPDEIEVDPEESEIIDEWDMFFPVKIEEIEENLNLTVNPNPFRDYLEINLNDITNRENIIDMYIVNVMGQTIKVFDLQNNENIIIWNGLNDNDEEVEKGIYFIILRCGKEIYKTKIVKI